jgi:proteasome lid subunit RPN8/RPN11
VLRLPNDLYLQMVAHCLTGLPDEACGLLVGDPATGEVTSCHPTRNVAASAKIYTVDPLQHLKIDREAEAQGREVIGVFHSHTHTDAYPSPTDIAQAPDPGWHYVLVSLRDTSPMVRSYAIVEGRVEEESLVVRSPATESLASV